MYTIIQTKEFGRGLYAAKHIKKGELIMQAELLVLSIADTATMNNTELKHYTFCFNRMQDCLVLGDGEIFNHSDTPNVSYELAEFEGRKVMRFFALKEIDVWTGSDRTQLFIDYNADTKVNTNNYIKATSLVG